MLEDVVKRRLKSLYDDLTYSSKEAVSLVNFMNESIDDKMNILSDFYFHDHSPVKVINTQNVIKGGNKDTTDELIEISIGYDTFIRNLGTETNMLLDRHMRALDLFLSMLSLPSQQARILYLRFFKCYTIEQTCEELFLSKTTCYRKQEKAIKLLSHMLKQTDN